MGRLFLFAVTNLDNEANNCDYEHAKLEHVRVCDHNPLPPFLSVGGRKKTFSLRETRWGPPACRLSVAPLLNYHIFPQKATPIPTGTGALFDSFCVLLYNDLARKGRRGSTIYGRRLALPHEGGDADVAESDASHRLDSDMYRVYALHLHHKSTIAAPTTDTAIVF